VTGLTVDNSSGVLAPTVRWAGPASGTAEYFAVAALELDVAPSGELSSTPVDYYVVFGNECPIRPNVLQVGTPYVFVIEAIACGQVQQAAPLRTQSGLTCTNAFNRTDIYWPMDN
jgi:hypothetical protein